MQSAFVYTREAHPGEHFAHHSSLEQKLDQAREMVRRFDIERPMLVDDLDGTVHRAYGALPNMSWIVSPAGTVLYRADWTDPRSVAEALGQLEHEREARGAGLRMTAFRSESVRQRASDPEAFMEGLLTAGPKAVWEFIAAVAHVRGEAAARPLRAWWDRVR